MAKKYWIYAAMSQNVYRKDKEQIGLPIEWSSLNAQSGVNGFYAETFVKKENNKITAIVIAFRGTEDWQDWVTGNIVSLQEIDAINYADSVIKSFGKLRTPVSIEVTGHSLGGALAQIVSNKFKIKAVVFDSSPRDGVGFEGVGALKTVLVFEEGEVLDWARKKLSSLYTGVTLPCVSYNFIANQDGSVENHSMHPLAKGMKALAAGNQDATPPSVTNTLPAIDNASTNTTSGLSGDEVAKALGPTKEHDRANAIAQMVKQGGIRSPLSADELAAILKGITGSNRSYAIAQLGALIKSRLTAREAATVLGAVNELREHDRAAAIQSIAKANSYAEIAADAALILAGITGSNRSFAIAQLAPRLRANLTGMEVSSILGPPETLREHDRAAAINSLVNAKRLRMPFSGDELGLVLTGTTGGNRSYAIGLLMGGR